MLLLPEDVWEVRTTEKKGKGVFAKKDILPGVVIGDYLGKIMPMEEEDTVDINDFYSMYYSETVFIYPDPQKNGIHLINHSCLPNAWMYTYKGHTLYFSLRHIFPGEELSVSYLVSPQDLECNPCTHLCACDSLFCSGTMHLTDKRFNAWDAFHTLQENRTEQEKVIANEELQKLSEYPENIPDDPIYPLFGFKNHAPKIIESQTLPSTQEIRNLLREHGSTLLFPALHLHILGVQENLLVSEVNI